MAEPAWMQGVHERDMVFGLPPTTLEQTETWACVNCPCANGDALYSVPAFLESRAAEYAKQDGWRRVNGQMLCPVCAQKAGESC